MQDEARKCRPCAHTWPAHCPLIAARIAHALPTRSLHLASRSVSLPTLCTLGAHHEPLIAHTLPTRGPHIAHSLPSDCPNIISHIWPISCSWPTHCPLGPSHGPHIAHPCAASLLVYSTPRVAHMLIIAHALLTRTLQVLSKWIAEQ